MPLTPRTRLAALSLVPLLLCIGCEQKPASSATAPSPRPAAPAPAPPAKSGTSAPGSASPPAAAPMAVPSVQIPGGQSTPEGVACDLASSFIRSDSRLLRASCFVITPGSPERDAYNNYLDETATLMDVGNAVPSANADWPASITRVFKARDLSAPGPAAFGLDQLGLTAVRFVDLTVTLRNGSTTSRRTLVVQDEGSKLWFAVPHSEHFPKLSEGLDAESMSTGPLGQ